MTVKDLYIFLIEHGYRYYKPISSTWKGAFIFKKDSSVLCILFRKNGIDLRFYGSYTEGIEIRSGNMVSMFGGDIFRNHFSGSENFIIKKIEKISRKFMEGIILDEIRIEDGRSYKLCPSYPYIQEYSKKNFMKLYKSFKDMKELKDNIRDVNDVIEMNHGYMGNDWGQ